MSGPDESGSPPGGEVPIDAPGWAAIDRHASLRLRGPTPHQFTSNTAYDLDSQNPLPCVTVWEGSAPARWHYVGYGLSELFEKSAPNPEISGFGFELTMNIPRGAETVPPAWPINLIQGIGRYVLEQRAPMDSGHCIDLGGSLRPEDDTPLSGVVCVPDPALGKIETPNGSVLFLCLFGLVSAEVEAMQAWELPRKVGLVKAVSPLCVTEPDRVAFAEDERYATIYRRHAMNVLVDP